MATKQIAVSIIIVHYKVKEDLFACLRSIEKSNTKISYEIIIVDNDEEKKIEKDLVKTFPNIIYIKAESNKGFGVGNNLGAANAKGKYFFFLNPDTRIKSNCIDILVSFTQSNKKIGIVAPLLLDPKGIAYPIQGARVLTPLRAIFSLSFLYKLFPRNIIASEYFLSAWDKKTIKEIDVVPGTAFLIRKNVFEKIGKFDERFFLFFEEHDICLRVQKLGYKIFTNPHAKIIHLWGRSTKKGENIKQIFRKSRYLYFRKHFGSVWAHVVAQFLR